MTGRDAAALIGRRATYRTGQLFVAVRIVNARTVYGRDDVQIEPIAGDGQQWVAVQSIQLAGNDPAERRQL